MSLQSLLCETAAERSLASFDYDENDLFLKSLTSTEILPSLESILSDENNFDIPVISETRPHDSSQFFVCDEKKSSDHDKSDFVSKSPTIPKFPQFDISDIQPYNMCGRYKPSLFSKCLAAKVKIEKHKLSKLQQIKKDLLSREAIFWLKNII